MGAALQAVAQERDTLAGRVLARVKRIEALQAAARVNVECASGEGDVVLSVDSAGRLVGLSLAPSCTTGYINVELEELLNSMLSAAGKTTASSRQLIPA